jgi:hypothetical protein
LCGFAQNSRGKPGAQNHCAPSKLKSQPVSRVLSRIIIHLDWKSPSSLKQPTRKRRGQRHSFPIWSCSGWGLPCRHCYQQRGALLPHHFTLTSRGWRFTFCCTCRGLAPPRRYLAPCPVEPGLSSSCKSSRRPATSDYPADLGAILTDARFRRRPISQLSRCYLCSLREIRRQTRRGEK